MTKDEFIDGYMARSGLPPDCRTEDGFCPTGGRPHFAMPCACGEEECEGWAMVTDPITHRKLYEPREPDEPILPDDYPIYSGYWYVADGKPVRSDYHGIRADRFRRLIGATELRRCDAVARGLPLL